MVDRVGRWAEILVALTIVIFAGATLYGARSLAPNQFEPIGSATIPQITAWITLALAAVVIADATIGLRRHGRQEETGAQWGSALIALVLAVIYVAVLSSGTMRYRWATMLFIPLVVLAITDKRWQALPWAIGLGVIYGFALDYVFRHVLVTDIP